MEAARPRGRGRRGRRGSVDRPLNVRLVRVASLVVAPALLAVLFSISTTGTLPAPALQPLFDEAAAATLATRLATEYPDRVPGSAGAAGAARWFEETMSAAGFETREDVWKQDVSGLGPVVLRNLVTVVPGRSAQAVVVLAHRDNQGAGVSFGQDAGGTAALIELARGYAPQEEATAARPQRTLVLVSTDGGAYGGAGAERFARTSPYAKDAFAAVVLDGIGRSGAPELAIAGGGARSPAPTLVATASARVREQTQLTPAIASIPTQLVDLGVPYAAGEQGPLLAAGVAAVTLTTADEGGAASSNAGLEQISTTRLGEFGRAAEALLGSIDASAARALGTPDMLFFRGRTMSGWTVRLALVVAVVPFALGVLDLVVRGRRKRLPLRPAARALRSRLLFWLYAGLLLWIGALTGVFPTGSALALPPTTSSVAAVPVAGLALLVLALALGWLVGRRRLLPTERPAPEERLAGYTVALAWLGAVALVVAFVHPYALIFLLPSLYAWLWLPLRTRFWTRAAVYCLGLLGPALGLLLLGRELGLSAFSTLVYVASLATVGYVSLGSVLAAIAWAAVAGMLGAIAFGRYAPYAQGAAHPPPGLVRESVGAVGRRVRDRRYARAR